MDQPAVTRDALPALTPLARPEPVPPPARRWTAAEWERIRRGHKALDMDDRWHAFVEGDRLFWHRSWTGYGVYEARFSQVGDCWQITELLVCGDRGRYRRARDEYEATLVEALIEGHLLGDPNGAAAARLRDMDRDEPRPGPPA